jgi:hypothetical protein
MDIEGRLLVEGADVRRGAWMIPGAVFMGRDDISGADKLEVEVWTMGELGSGGMAKWLLVNTTGMVVDGSAGPGMVGCGVGGRVDVLFTVPVGQK